jgi:hypothetical protein
LGEGDSYRPLKSPQTDPSHACDAISLGAENILVLWFGVFVFNLIVPFLFGLLMTNKGGRIGMAIAVVMLFAAGCWICANHREIGIFLIAGGFLIGLSQMVPVLQIAGGMVGVAICHLVGLTDSEDATNEFGGFLLTLITGASLMSLSAVSGFLIEQFILDRRASRQNKSGKAGVADKYFG